MRGDQDVDQNMHQHKNHKNRKRNMNNINCGKLKFSSSFASKV